MQSHSQLRCTYAVHSHHLLCTYMLDLQAEALEQELHGAQADTRDERQPPRQLVEEGRRVPKQRLMVSPPQLAARLGQLQPQAPIGMYKEQTETLLVPSMHARKFVGRAAESHRKLVDIPVTAAAARLSIEDWLGQDMYEENDVVGSILEQEAADQSWR